MKLGWLALLVATTAVAAPKAEVSVAITTNGVWLGTGGKRCFVARKAGALDVERVADELRRARGDRAVNVTISPDRGVTYQDLITVMDGASKAGLLDSAVGEPEELAIQFDDRAASRRAATGHCSAPPAVKPVARPADPALTRLAPPPGADKITAQLDLPAPAKPALRKAPLVVITKTSLTLNGRELATVAVLADGRGAIQPLLEQLEAMPHDPAKPELIIQADGGLDATVIRRAASTAALGGFPHVLFAVTKQ